MSATESSSDVGSEPDGLISFVTFRNCVSSIPYTSGAKKWGEIAALLENRSFRETKDGPAISFVKLKEEIGRAHV